MIDAHTLTQNLGISDKEAKVYLAVLELGGGTVQEIAARAAIKRTSIYYFIDHLVELGLIEQLQVGRRVRYQPTSPERLVELQKQRAAQLEQLLPEFMSVYNVSTKKPRISYFEGPEQMKNIIKEEPRCQAELLCIWSAQEVTDLFGTEFLGDIDRARREKGIKVRVIRIQAKDETFGPYRGGPGQNRELRYTPEGTDFPMAISIYDTGKVGLMTSRKEGFGILIESTEYVQAMRVLFEALWAQSRPAEIDGSRASA